MKIKRILSMVLALVLSIGAMSITKRCTAGGRTTGACIGKRGVRCSTGGLPLLTRRAAVSP